MRTSEIDILIVPGRTNSGPDHWQTRWEQRLKTSRRVMQDDWQRAHARDWSRRIVDAAQTATRPTVLVAHSLGVAAVAHAANRMAGGHIIGAFLVAPISEAEARKNPDIDGGFTPYPRDPLPFPSLLVASRNDRLCSYEDAGDLALSWGSTLVDAGDVGHLNTASGHGPWPEGAMRFGWFLRTLGNLNP
jgi:uncharacterized protein